jgi:NhaA family Na+:H+ antiporter
VDQRRPDGGVFFLVGLEIKRELVRGELSSLSQGGLAGAGGGWRHVHARPDLPCVQHRRSDWPQGMGHSGRDRYRLRGLACWHCSAIACRASLKIFLLALAILDDLGAIVIIALFYTKHLSWMSLGLAAYRHCRAVGAQLARRDAARALSADGRGDLVCVLKSGVHATLAGVVVAFALPLVSRNEGEPTLLEQLEESLHPWIAFGVLPLFAFANAGVSLQGLSLAKLLEPVPLGIALGAVHRQAARHLRVSAGWRSKAVWPAKPRAHHGRSCSGVGLLGGIGFTMSLFIGTLGLRRGRQGRAAADWGVLAGSLLSATAGYLLLRLSAGSSASAPLRSPE